MEKTHHCATRRLANSIEFGRPVHLVRTQDGWMVIIGHYHGSVIKCVLCVCSLVGSFVCSHSTCTFVLRRFEWKACCSLVRRRIDESLDVIPFGRMKGEEGKEEGMERKKERKKEVATQKSSSSVRVWSPCERTRANRTRNSAASLNSIQIDSIKIKRVFSLWLVSKTCFEFHSVTGYFFFFFFFLHSSASLIHAFVRFRMQLSTLLIFILLPFRTSPVNFSRQRCLPVELSKLRNSLSFQNRNNRGSLRFQSLSLPKPFLLVIACY